MNPELRVIGSEQWKEARETPDADRSLALNPDGKHLEPDPSEDRDDGPVNYVKAAFRSYGPKT